MKVIIAGGRDFNDHELLVNTLKHVRQEWDITEIVSGCARGADQMGELYALWQGIPIKRFPAAWHIYDKQAGFIRNSLMAEYADAAIIFWDGFSRGTAHMIDQANRRDLKFRVIDYVC